MRVRWYTIHALGRIHVEPKLVVPVLIRCLGNNPVGVDNEAADALGIFGADAQAAIPVLIESLASPDSDLRTRATNAPILIDPEAAAKAGGEVKTEAANPRPHSPMTELSNPFPFFYS